MEPTNPPPEQPKESKAIVRDTTPVGQLMEQVAYKRVQIERVLPKWMTVDRFLTQVRFALSMGKSAPKLQACSPQSVVNSVLMAADLGLDPSGRLGSAWLVPYGNECQLIPGYRGLIDLAVRSGFVRSVNAWVVHELDQFTPVNGRTPKHVPYLPKGHEQDNPGPVYAAWGRYKTRDGGDESEIMSLRELNLIRDRSAGYRSAIKYGSKDNPWLTDPEEQYKKTVIRRMLKKAPLNPTGALNEALEKYMKAVSHDDEVEGAGETEGVVVDETPKQSKTEQLKKDL